MKTRLKQRINKIMFRLFGNVPYPSEKKDELKFTPIDYPEREGTLHDFNRTWKHIYHLNYLNMKRITLIAIVASIFASCSVYKHDKNVRFKERTNYKKLRNIGCPENSGYTNS